jgi:hypothetical protein
MRTEFSAQKYERILSDAVGVEFTALGSSRWEQQIPAFVSERIQDISLVAGVKNHDFIESVEMIIEVMKEFFSVPANAASPVAVALIGVLLVCPLCVPCYSFYTSLAAMTTTLGGSIAC